MANEAAVGAWLISPTQVGNVLLRKDKVQDAGRRTQDTGHRIRDTGRRTQRTCSDAE